MTSHSDPPFIPGLELSRRFYWEAVRPVLDAEFPSFKHSAALIGPGSEVLGFDTFMSTDHHWGPRAMLFVADEEPTQIRDKITEELSERLPREFLGYSTHFTPPDLADNGTQVMEAAPDGLIRHRVEVLPLNGYFTDYLGFDPRTEIEPADWLTFPEQKLLSITAGGVFQDDLGLERIRQRFSYYPRDVWLYLLAAGWTRIGQEEHLMGRAGHAGDEIGSALIGARLVRDVMMLCFLMERQYAPYAKWFGTAFMRLSSGPELGPILLRTLAAETWQERSKHLASAYEYAAAKHNALGITDPLPAACSLFWGRPFPVIHGERFARAILAEVGDPEIGRLAERLLVGGIDQISDNTDILENTPRAVTRRLFE